MLLWDRHVSIRFPGAERQMSGEITYARDQGPRIAFEFTRSIRAEPDRGTVRIWNIPAELSAVLANDSSTFRAALQAVQNADRNAVPDAERASRLHRVIEDHVVEVWAGYGDDPQLIFRGDMIALRPNVRDGLDTVLEIDLGDGFTALQSQWMAASYGVGETPGNLLAFAAALASAGTDDGKMRAAISLVAPNAVTARLTNGWVGQGRPADTIAEIADFLGLYWWVREGRVEFVNRAGYLPDFAVELSADTCLIETAITEDGKYHTFTSVLAGQIHPGRAVRIVPFEGTPIRCRVLETHISGDTHGDTWAIWGLADGNNWGDDLPVATPWVFTG